MFGELACGWGNIIFRSRFKCLAPSSDSELGAVSCELGVWSLPSRHHRRRLGCLGRLLGKLNDLKPTAKNIVPSAAYCT